MNVVAIVQARLGSTRLPNKVMKKICNYTMIELLIRRLQKSNEINKIVLATSDNPKDEILVNYIKKLGFECEVGNEDDVLSRYLNVATIHNADAIVRITGDCPLIDPLVVDNIIREFKTKNIDYISNTIKPTFPDGLDTEVFAFTALKRANEETKNKFDREHVTPYIKKSKLFKIKNYENDKDYSHLRWTVDDIDDFMDFQRFQ